MYLSKCNKVAFDIESTGRGLLTNDHPTFRMVFETVCGFQVDVTLWKPATGGRAFSSLDGKRNESYVYRGKPKSYYAKRNSFFLMAFRTSQSLLDDSGNQTAPFCRVAVFGSFLGAEYEDKKETEEEEACFREGNQVSMTWHDSQREVSISGTSL